MPDDRRISELTTAEQTSASDLFETAIPNALSSTGFVSKKNSLATLATFMANTLAFTNLLDTQAKTLIGAINECFASSGGASVAMGTTDPSDASGSNGDLYIKYDGTSYAVLGFWVKINNAWRTISTGGGMAFVEITQADYNQLSYADKHAGIPYLITDGVLPAIEAADVTYDNTGSTLSADEVNEAIDELDAEKMKHIKDLPAGSDYSPAITPQSSHYLSVSDGTHEYKAPISDVVELANVPPSANTSSNFGLFFTFGTVKDGANYYSNSCYVPIGWKIDENTVVKPSSINLSKTGCYYRLYTSDSTYAGMGTNILCKLVEDV